MVEELIQQEGPGAFTDVVMVRCMCAVVCAPIACSKSLPAKDAPTSWPSLRQQRPRACTPCAYMLARSCVRFACVRVQACGSGGTTAGTALGLHLSGYGARCHAFGVCDTPDYFYDFIDGLLAAMGAAPEQASSYSPCMQHACTHACAHARSWSGLMLPVPLHGAARAAWMHGWTGQACMGPQRRCAACEH